MDGVPLDFLPRKEDVGIYDEQWESIEVNLRDWICLYDQEFKKYAESLYNILVQYVGTIDVGGNIIARQNIYNNGRKYHLDLKGNFQTESHEQTKSHNALNTIQNSHYDNITGNLTLKSTILFLSSSLTTYIMLVEFKTSPNRIRSIILRMEP